MLLAAVPLMGSPGPATLGLAGVGSAFGFKASLPYLSGIISGTICVVLIIATGLSGLISLQPALAQVITWCAVAYILYLAWRIASAPVGDRVLMSKASPRFASGFALSVTNPKAFAAIGAVYSTHAIFEHEPIMDGLAKLLSLSFATTMIALSWLSFGAVFSRIINHPFHGRSLNIVFAVLLVVSVSLVILNS